MHAAGDARARRARPAGVELERGFRPSIGWEREGGQPGRAVERLRGRGGNQALPDPARAGQDQARRQRVPVNGSRQQGNEPAIAAHQATERLMAEIERLAEGR